MTSTYHLFSRDIRTEILFRTAWISAIAALEMQSTTYQRKSSFFCISLFQFLQLRSQKRIIFGTSEILFYALFSSRSDIWVFTGLGRLLLKKGFLSRLTIFILKISYRNQKLIVLNTDDEAFLGSLFNSTPFLLDGEGYRFDKRQFESSIKMAEKKFYDSKRSKLKFAFVGRLLKSKGLEDLLPVILELVKIHDIELHLFGDMDFNNNDSISSDWLEDIIQLSEGTIIRHGYTQNINLVLSDIDVLISLSKREGLPFSVLDAIQNACSLVLSNVPGHREFEDYPSVYLHSHDKLHTMLCKIASSPNEYCRPKDLRVTYDLASDRFGMDKIIKQIHRIVDT